MKKFISPGSWFAFAYPEEWFEFSEEADCFLFYNPEKWDGNFRISAYRDASSSFGDSMMRQALKASGSKLSKVGRWETIYSAESFTEQLVEYVTHRWTIGCGQTCVECSFTEEAQSGKALGMVNALIASLEILQPRDTFHNQFIPVRVSEVDLIESCYATIEELGMKIFKERFRDFDYNVRLLQKLTQRAELTEQLGADAGAVMGVVLCALLTESIEGLEWNTYVNGKVEAPVLMYGTTCVARPMLLFGKQGELLTEVAMTDIVDEIRARIEEAASC
ncbi:MAG: DUF3805 domain-containing protein [Bacteroidaceae bacterium]|nr:DUF3805 domain-containing protein [Bacteroidaceae bacterium]